MQHARETPGYVSPKVVRDSGRYREVISHMAPAPQCSLSIGSGSNRPGTTPVRGRSASSSPARQARTPPRTPGERTRERPTRPEDASARLPAAPAAAPGHEPGGHSREPHDEGR